MVSALVDRVSKQLQLITLVLLFLIFGMITVSVLFVDWHGGVICLLRVCFGVVFLVQAWSWFHPGG